MKHISLLLICCICLMLSGCGFNKDFMVPKKESKIYDKQILTGMFSGIVSEGIKSDLSGTRNDVKGYAVKYYDDELSGYVNDINQQISGSIQNLKDKHNEGINEVSDYISNEASNIIKSKLDTLKL